MLVTCLSMGSKRRGERRGETVGLCGNKEARRKEKSEINTCKEVVEKGNKGIESTSSYLTDQT